MKNKLMLSISILSLGLMSGCATTNAATIQSPVLSTYQKVIDLPGINKDQIYEGSHQWFAKNFQNSNSVIKYENKDTGSLIGKGSMKLVCPVGVYDLDCHIDTNLDFTVKVDSKDEKVRLTFEDLMIHRLPVSGGRSESKIPVVNIKSWGESNPQKVKVVTTMLDNTINDLSNDIKNTTKDSKW